MVTDSKETLRFIKKKLTDCDETHSICRVTRPNSTWYPTRLIDLKPLEHVDDERAKLIITAEHPISGPYASLSHCWGGREPLKLTDETLDLFMDAIDDGLPRTFLDAFKVTRALGIRYLWIDALCIIQGSATDWSHEAELMLDVYKHAYVNIASTHAPHSHYGIFTGRDPTMLYEDLELDCGPLKGTFRLVDRKYWEREIDQAPLNRRAWVVQERLVSPRILHYASEQVLWDCYESMACEAFLTGPRAWIATGGTDSFYSPKISSQLMQVPKNELQALGKWAAIVQAYSSSELTFPEKDKIIAIAGLANQLQDLWKDEYCAGLWRKRLELQLCWLALHPNQKAAPDVLRAPSWSWLSFDGPVYCSQPQLYETGYELVSLASVTDIQLRNEALASTNHVVLGHIALRCVLSPVVFVQEKNKFFTMNRESKELPLLRVDLDYANSASGRLFFIPLYDVLYQRSAKSEINDASEIRGILVRLVDETSGSYVRCGHVFVAGKAGSDGFEPEYADLKIAEGREKIPCLDFDLTKGHLIMLV
jgi:hypothetical protein